MTVWTGRAAHGCRGPLRPTETSQRGTRLAMTAEHARRCIVSPPPARPADSTAVSSTRLPKRTSPVHHHTDGRPPGLTPATTISCSITLIMTNSLQISGFCAGQTASLANLLLPAAQALDRSGVTLAGLDGLLTSNVGHLDAEVGGDHR